MQISNWLINTLSSSSTLITSTRLDSPLTLALPTSSLLGYERAIALQEGQDWPTSSVFRARTRAAGTPQWRWVRWIKSVPSRLKTRSFLKCRECPFPVTLITSKRRLPLLIIIYNTFRKCKIRETTKWAARTTRPRSSRTKKLLLPFLKSSR